MTFMISHSEVDSFLSCPRKHYYAFGHPNAEGGKGLEPSSFGDGLYRGLRGHEALQIYYTGLSVNLPQQQCRDKALAHITKVMMETPERIELLMELHVILGAYFDHYAEEDVNTWEYLAVEVTFEYQDFPFTPDLIRRHRKQGFVQVVDHKFLANLYTGEEIGIQPQLPKYVGALRASGMPVKDAVYNLISTRVYKTKPYEPAIQLKRVPLHLTAARVEVSMHEQKINMERISALKSLPNHIWKSSITRHASSFNCKNCPFLGLCIAELNGQDVTLMVQHNYKPNTYGYNEEKVDVKL